MTRKTADDSQELILLIGQSYLITVWSQGIWCLRCTANTTHLHQRVHNLLSRKTTLFVQATTKTKETKKVTRKSKHLDDKFVPKQVFDCRDKARPFFTMASH